MKMFIEFFLNPVTHYSVIFGFLIYFLYHQYMIDGLLRRHKLNLGFSDKLLLFRIPIWQPNVRLDNTVLAESRHLARQFIFMVFLVLMFYLTFMAVSFLALA